MTGELTEALASIAEQKAAKVVFVYLAEAHSVDAWPLSREGSRSHESMEERLQAAQAFLERFPQLAALVGERLFVDDLEDATTKNHGLWPERYLLLEGQTVRWASTLCFEKRSANLSKALIDAANEVW